MWIATEKSLWNGAQAASNRHADSSTACGVAIILHSKFPRKIISNHRTDLIVLILESYHTSYPHFNALCSLFSANIADADALVDSEYQTDTKDEENGKPGPKILEPPVKIQADAAECGKPGGPEKTHTSSASGSGQTENKASSEKQIKTPDDQKHIHEKTDICSVICHVNGKQLFWDL